MLALSVAVILDPGGYLSVFESKTVDARYRFYAKPSSHTGDIIILDISEESIKRLEPVYGRWPWPRSVHGEVVEYLKSEGAAVIGFDIIFSEHAQRREIDAVTINELSSFVKNADIPEVRSELLRRVELLNEEFSDSSFVSAVEKAGNVILPSVFYVNKTDLAANPGLAAGEEDSQKIGAALSASSITGSGNNTYPAYFNATVPFAALAAASGRIGHINYSPDRDGVSRKFLPLISFQNSGKAYPAFSLLIASHIKGVPPEDISRTLPILPDGSAYIRYQGGNLTGNRFESFYRYIPYDYVLASKDMAESGREPLIQQGSFRDKIVLVSASAAGLSDLRATPFSPVTPGIEIHANIIDSLLSGSFIHPLAPEIEMLYIAILAAVIAAVGLFLTPYAGFFSVSALAGGVTAINWAIFGNGYLLPVVKPVAAMTAVYLCILLMKYVTEHRERRYLKSAFSRYVAPPVLEEILKSPEKLRLGGERRFMTVLFSDLEGFTTMSEELSPEDVSLLLNEYLTSMVGCIMRNSGTLDKFMGDAVMAIWNAPAVQGDHAALACETAIMMRKELEGLRLKWREEGRPLLNSRIGINTGEMIAGNMGSSEIFDYTVLGSEVNAASRMEGLNKEFGTRIMVSESTRDEAEKHAPGRFAFRRLAQVVLKGKNRPLEVYELVGLMEETGSSTLLIMEEFDKGLRLFTKGAYSEAKEVFRSVLDKQPDDGPSRLYLSLSEDHESNPPSNDMGGVYVQKAK